MPEKKPKVVITQDEAAPVAHEVLAASVLKLSKAAVDLQLSGLTNDDLALLVQRRCSSVSLGNVKLVLQATVDLALKYAKK